eukprot:7641665-Karenia_brevis.AAC.1
MLEKAKAAVKASQKKEFAENRNNLAHARSEKVIAGKGFSTDDVHRWLLKTRQRKTKNGKAYVQEAQYEILKK